MGPDDWTEWSVEDIKAPTPNALATGPFGSAISSRHFLGEGVPVLRGSNLSGDVGVRLNDRGLAFLSHEKASEFARSVARRGDLVFTCWGSIDQVGLVDGRSRFEEYVVSNKQMKLTPDPKRADSLFLYYLFSSALMRDRIVSEGIGSSVPGFNLGQLRSIRLRLPAVSEQKALAGILAALDNKIHLNRRMSESIESIARALFKSWLVDFDPVRARCDGRATGFPEQIARLFPDAFEDTEHGEIPKGWSYRPLGDLVDLTRGRTYKGNLKGLPGPVLLGLASIRRNGGFREDNLSTYGGASPEDLLLYPGELFASLKDVTQAADLLGAVARVPGHVKAGRLTQDTVKLGLKSERTSRSILYRCLLTDAYRGYCRAHATGTTNLGLSRNDFLAFPVPQPSAAVGRLYDAINSSLDDRMACLTEESQTLAATRDALLPKLISGELRLDGRAHTVQP